MREPRIAQVTQKRITPAPMRKLGLRSRSRIRSRRAALASERPVAVGDGAHSAASYLMRGLRSAKRMSATSVNTR